MEMAFYRVKFQIGTPFVCLRQKLVVIESDQGEAHLALTRGTLPAQVGDACFLCPADKQPYLQLNQNAGRLSTCNHYDGLIKQIRPGTGPKQEIDRKQS